MLRIVVPAEAGTQRGGEGWGSHIPSPSTLTPSPLTGEGWGEGGTTTPLGTIR